MTDFTNSTLDWVIFSLYLKGTETTIGILRFRVSSGNVI